MRRMLSASAAALAALLLLLGARDLVTPLRLWSPLPALFVAPLDAAYIPTIVVTSISRGAITINSGSSSATTGSIAVQNSSYVRLRFLGYTTNDTASSSAADDLCGLTLNTVDSTHVTVTAARAGTGSGFNCVAGYEVMGVAPAFVKSIQAGTGNTTITSVNINKTEVDWLGTNNGAVANAEQINTRCSLSDATHIVCTDAGGVTTRGQWRAFEWR